MANTSDDMDQQETDEWLAALASVVEADGPDRAHYLIERLIDQARRSGINLPYSASTAYVNTIPVSKQQPMPGDQSIERRILALVRWNAMAMVVQANRGNPDLGGHIASFASAATLYDVAFNHFFRGRNDQQEGDLVFFQGHSAPGIYARAFLEGRITEQQLLNFRQESTHQGLSSYPHPWLMKDFWQFPTVSMGLGPMMAIYQARFMKYLHNREMMDAKDRTVWAYLGDGEMDEPESIGALSMAGRERLDNLVFVVNCNLQRLDGPVRGNGKIIQELESLYRGAGWNVIKVIWGSRWDPLLANDHNGLLRQLMEEAVDGDYQIYKAKGGAYTREHFFGRHADTKAMVANMSDTDIWRLNRGGHDAHKIYAAYAEATQHKGQPTVILAKTVKGYGMGEAGEGQNITHSQKKMGEEALKAFRDRFSIPISDDDIAQAPFFKPAEDSEEMQYLKARRAELGGYLPTRRTESEPLEIPDLSIFKNQLKSTGDRQISTTMVFVRLLTALTRDKKIGKNIVPIVPDEARTFGMEGMFQQLAIYSSVGQLYTPQDADQLMSYREDIKGQILQEGINEAGAFSSWIAAATSYSHHGFAMIPFYIYYSMFGFQRIGDLAWAAGDMQARGFLLGGTAGRTTLNGEGLQHQDGHSHLVASTIPNCVSYDPTFSYELAVIIHDGLRRMFEQQESIFYYITVMNENYQHPDMPDGVEAGILKGLYLFQAGQNASIQLFGCGTILREVIAGAALLAADFGIEANIWSVTSFNELRRDALKCQRDAMLHPEAAAAIPYVTECLQGTQGPVVASTDYMRIYADQIREFLPNKRYYVLGTDGFGRSDSRKALRTFFEVDKYYVVVAALKALADDGSISAARVTEALEKYGIDADKPNPMSV